MSKAQRLPLSKIKPNPANLRIIKDDNFKKLVKYTAWILLIAVILIAVTFNLWRPCNSFLNFEPVQRRCL